MKGLKTEVLDKKILVAAYDGFIRMYVIENEMVIKKEDVGVLGGGDG